MENGSKGGVDGNATGSLTEGEKKISPLSVPASSLTPGTTRRAIVINFKGKCLSHLSRYYQVPSFRRFCCISLSKTYANCDINTSHMEIDSYIG